MSESVIQLLDQIRFGQPASVRDWRAEVPEEVEAVCLRCLHKVPEERYRNAEVLADELARIINRWEADRVRVDAGVGQEGSGFGRVFMLVGLVATVILGVVLAREAGWFNPRGTTAPTTAPAGDQNKRLPANAMP